MALDFAHLHVASGFSMRYGASMPEALVERAAQHGQQSLALTDRDGLYGAGRFTTAAAKAGIAPVLGGDLACAPELLTPARRQGTSRARTPVRGGAYVDPRLSRVTLLGRGVAAGVPHGAGWRALCRLVSEAHGLGGSPGGGSQDADRGNPVTDRDRI